MKRSLRTATLRSLPAVAVALGAALAFADEDLDSTQAADQGKPGVVAQNQPVIAVPAMPKIPTITPPLKKRSSVLTLTGRGSSPVIVKDANGNVVEIIDQRTLRPLNRLNPGIMEREVDRRKSVLEAYAETQELKMKTLAEAQETMKSKAAELERARTQALRERELQTQTHKAIFDALTPGLSPAARARMERGTKYRVDRNVKQRDSIRRQRSVGQRRLRYQ